MSNRQLEDIEEERFNNKLAKILGISSDELGELDWNIDTDESDDGFIYSRLILLSEDSPKHVLDKIYDLDDNNTLYLNPYVFEEPNDENFDMYNENPKYIINDLVKLFSKKKIK